MDEENGNSPYQAPRSPEVPPSIPLKPTFIQGTWPVTKWILALIALGVGIADGATSAHGMIPAGVLGAALGIWVVTVFPGFLVYYCGAQPVVYNVVMLTVSGLSGLGLGVLRLGST